ncbi:threonylcarbamoyl-AMP synthase [Oscillibacter valericigenes]|nr:threonylcarbamoyl-AMP synthase [Oscillibacter valericigenes]
MTDPARESAAVGQAAEILRRGGLLAIPTETVYGLGADGLNEDAVRHIFEAKGRPQDNPLILHIPDAGWLARYCKNVPETAYRLAERFWPGPLTMILSKADCVPLVTTGGLDTVGMRCPDHAVTRAIIAAAGVPVAAPSANTSGRPSCTSAAHVREDMDGRIDGVVDGGACRVGVESTIIDLTCTPPRLLRPGGLPLEDLREVLGEVAVDKAVTQPMAAGEKPRAPGMKYRHYAPKAPVTVVTGAPRASARRLLASLGERDGVICFDEFAPLFAGQIVHRLGASGDKLAQSQRVFDALRTFDETQVPAIWAQCPDSAGLGFAVGNRLKKAAGFHTESADEGVLVLGITGGTGAGKTTLLRALERHGALVLDCDAVYHEMLRSDAPLRADLTAAFGEVFAPDGGLDRQKLGKIVFGDDAALARLDGIIFRHLPRALARRMEASGARLIALDAIKLIESGLGTLCDVTVAVTAPEEVRVRRIMARDGISEDYARARVRAQRSEEDFRADCGAVFENNYPTPAQAALAAEEFVDTIIKKSKED